MRLGALECALAFVLICLMSDSAAAQTFTTLHTFTGGTDGGFAFAPLILDDSGNLYGTTYQGGTYNCDPNNSGRGCGVVFRMDNQGNETVLYSFQPSPDAQLPDAGLTRDRAGNLYGTTFWGGTHITYGAVYKVDPSGKETVLHSFNRDGGGYHPTSGLIHDGAGNLYGTTVYGGILSCVIQRTEYGCGVVFKINRQGNETVLHKFHGGDGAWPNGELLRDAQGNLYGTASVGTSSAGVVFKIDSSGKFHVLHQFPSQQDDGYTPTGSLVRDAAGNLYGTTQNGGAANYGTVYKLDKTGKITILYSFALGADGGLPEGGLVRDTAGNLYGTTSLGGDLACNGGSGCGTIFKIDSSGHETVLHNFEGKPGEFPDARLVIDAAGAIYGTTPGNDLANYGSVFKLVP